MSEEKFSCEEAMMRWQYTLLICDWKRLTKVIASIAALLQVAIDVMKAKFDDARTEEMRVAYQDCIKMLENVLAGNKDRIGDITNTYKNLISGENDFGQYCLAAMRKENMRLESEVVGLKAHVEALGARGHLCTSCKKFEKTCKTPMVKYEFYARTGVLCRVTRCPDFVGEND